MDNFFPDRQPSTIYRDQNLNKYPVSMSPVLSQLSTFLAFDIVT